MGDFEAAAPHARGKETRRRGAQRLLLKLAALALAIALSGVAIGQFHQYAEADNYILSVLEKDRMARNTPSPKIILVGGSNLAFGIDSKEIQDSLGLNVVNMGLYAKLGLKYMLVQARPYIKSGDVAVIVPEYDQFYGEYANGDNTLNTALLYAPADRIPDFIESYSIVDVLLRPRVENARRAFLRAIAAAAGKEEQAFPKDTNEVYNRHSFNQYGDAVSHLGKKGMNPDSIYVKPLPAMREFNGKIFKELNSVERRAQEVNAHAYFMFPSYIDRSYVINVAAIDSLARRIRSGTSMEVVGTPQDFVFPKTYFYDTRYHLNAIGRETRTQEMIRLLRAQGMKDGWLPRNFGTQVLSVRRD
jgi:hypothetical protein